MPTPKIHTAVSRMHFIEEDAPFTFPVFQELTGLKNGWHPPDDTELPPGLSRTDVNHILDYLDQLRAKPTEDSRNTFASVVVKRRNKNDPPPVDSVPGRVIWRKWIIYCWGKWKIQGIITSILAANQLLPLDEMLQDGTTDFNPSPALHLVWAKVGEALFGNRVLTPNARPPRLAPLWSGPVQTIVQRSYENLKNQARRTLSRIEMKQKGLIKIVEDLIENETPSKEGVRKLITAIASFTPDVRAFPSVDNEILLATANMELLEIMHAIGIVEEDEIASMIEESNTSVKVKQYKASAAPRVKKASFEALAAQEDVEDLRSLFQTVAGPVGAMPDIDIVEDTDATEEVGDDRGDLGVAFEANKTYDDLITAMGLDRFGLLAMFNRVRHKHGLTSWTKAGKAIFAEYDQGGRRGEFKIIRFHWHQLAGMHATLRKIFTKEPSSHPSGVLIADEVGLGKTFLAIAVAIFVIQLGMQSSKPPIIRTFQYLGDSPDIPDLATLILLPGTVVSQWLTEIYTLLRLHYVDVFIYPTSKAGRQAYWDQHGIFAKSKHSPRHRIVVASQSTLLQDFNSLWETGKTNRSRPWDHPEKLEDFEDNVGKTLYGQQWLSIIFDEAQGSRNCGAKHSAALLILERCKIRLILTATPLQTRPEDLAAIGRLVGIRYFSTQRHYEQQTLYLSDYRRARADRGSGPDGEECPLMEVLIAETLRLREKFGNRVIHRTKNSLDDRGRPLLQLPPCDIVLFIIALKDWELEYVDASVGDDALESVSQATSAGLSTENFFLKERMGVVFPREEGNAPLPVYSTRQEWEAHPPSKLNALVLLVRHLLQSDDAPMPYTRDYEMVFPEIPADKPAKQTRKILLFNEFPFFAPLIIQVLKLYGIKALAINGSLTYQQRAKVVDKFKTQPGFRVLIFSKVGTVGLNLTEADVLIFLDQQWSESENEQAIGRLYRQGQQRPVTIFHILASGSIDFFLYALAKSKGTMSEAFLSNAIANVASEKQKRLVELATGYQPLADEAEEEEEEEEEEPKPNPKRKVKAKTTDRVLTDEEESATKPVVKKVRRKKRPKSSRFIVDNDHGSDGSMPGMLGTSGSERSAASTPPVSSEGEDDDFVPRIPDSFQPTSSGIHLTEDLFQEPKRNAAVPRARDSFITLRTKQDRPRGGERRAGHATALSSQPTSSRSFPAKVQEAVSHPSRTLPLPAARQVPQAKPPSLHLHQAVSPHLQQEREGSSSPIDAFETPSPHQNASPPRPDDDYSMDEEDFIDRRNPMDEDDEDDDDSMQGIVDTPVRPSAAVNTVPCKKRQRSGSSAVQYPPRPLSYVRPTQLDNRTQKREHRTQELAAPVPSMFYEPALRKPVERTPTPPRRSAAHRRLPSDDERPRPDFMGDSEMEDAVLGPSNPQRGATHSADPQHLPDYRGSSSSFNPSSSSHSHSSTRGRPQSSNQASSQPEPARPLLSAQSRPSKPVASQPIPFKADVDRHLIGRRLQQEIGRGSTATTLSTPSTSASSTPTAQPSVIDLINRTKGRSWGSSTASGSLRPSPKYPNPFARRGTSGQQGGPPGRGHKK